MAKVIAVYNNKGGVAKTSSCSNIGSALTVMGKNVLLIDCDPQANLTVSVGVDDEKLDITIYDLLKSASITKSSVSKVIVHTIYKNLDIIPSDITLSDAEISLSTALSRETILRRIVNTVRSDYDYIFIDCPPSLGLLSINALCASDSIIVPVVPDYFSIKGLNHLLNTYNAVKQNINPDLSICGILLTKFNRRKNLSNNIKENLINAFGNSVFNTMIRIDCKIEYAQDNQIPAIFYSPTSHASEDYRNVANEIIRRDQNE